MVGSLARMVAMILLSTGSNANYLTVTVGEIVKEEEAVRSAIINRRVVEKTLATVQQRPRRAAEILTCPNGPRPMLEAERPTPIR